MAEDRQRSQVLLAAGVAAVVVACFVAWDHISTHRHKAAQPDGEKERFRAFDRDRDLLRGNVDRKRLAEVVDDSKKLDSKFARGERRFL